MNAFWQLIEGLIRTQSQKEGVKLIVDHCFMAGVVDKRHLAYILATAHHETGGLMQPVREGFAKTDADAIRIVTRMYEQGRIKTNYAAPSPVTGLSYFGRGLVQITWEEVYRRVGKLIGVDLANHPELALDPDISAKILVRGMDGGWFTGRKLSDYTKVDGFDYINARRIVNGLDRAAHIAGLASSFESAINFWQTENR